MCIKVQKVPQKFFKCLFASPPASPKRCCLEPWNPIGGMGFSIGTSAVFGSWRVQGEGERLFEVYVFNRVNAQDTVDGRNPANQLRLVVYPIVYAVSRCFTSQVVQDFFHRQHLRMYCIDMILRNFAVIPFVLW